MTTETNHTREEPVSAPKASERDAYSRPPRLGSFVTIAAALLLLFGAASRMGKVEETAALFGIDRQAESRINDEMDRIRAALSLGAAPVSANEPTASAGGFPIDPNAMPPPRRGVDIDDMRLASANDGERWSVSSVSAQEARGGVSGHALPPAAASPSPMVREYPPPVTPPEARGGGRILEDALPHDVTAAPANPQPLFTEDQYVVTSGDTWVRIARRTLGDANRWRDIQKANPDSANGLEVGMRLKIPR